MNALFLRKSTETELIDSYKLLGKVSQPYFEQIRRNPVYPFQYFFLKK